MLDMPTVWGILTTYIQETRSVSTIRCSRGRSYSVGSLRIQSTDQDWLLTVLTAKDYPPKPPTPDDRNRSSLYNVTLNTARTVDNKSKVVPILN
jgi:hypothetical protein